MTGLEGRHKFGLVWVRPYHCLQCERLEVASFAPKGCRQWGRDAVEIIGTIAHPRRCEDIVDVVTTLMMLYMWTSILRRRRVEQLMASVVSSSSIAAKGVSVNHDISTRPT